MCVRKLKSSQKYCQILCVKTGNWRIKDWNKTEFSERRLHIKFVPTKFGKNRKKIEKLSIGNSKYLVTYLSNLFLTSLQ